MDKAVKELWITQFERHRDALEAPGPDDKMMDFVETLDDALAVVNTSGILEQTYELEFSPDVKNLKPCCSGVTFTIAEVGGASVAKGHLIGEAGSAFRGQNFAFKAEGMIEHVDPEKQRSLELKADNSSVVSVTHKVPHRNRDAGLGAALIRLLEP